MILIRFSMPVAGSIQSIGFRTYSFTWGGVGLDGGVDDDGADIGIGIGTSVGAVNPGRDDRYAGWPSAATPSVGYPNPPDATLSVDGPAASEVSVARFVESENGSSDKLTLPRAGNSVCCERGEEEDEGRGDEGLWRKGFVETGEGVVLRRRGLCVRISAPWSW